MVCQGCGGQQRKLWHDVAQLLPPLSGLAARDAVDRPQASEESTQTDHFMDGRRLYAVFGVSRAERAR